MRSLLTVFLLLSGCVSYIPTSTVKSQQLHAEENIAKIQDQLQIADARSVDKLLKDYSYWVGYSTATKRILGE